MKKKLLTILIIVLIVIIIISILLASTFLFLFWDVNKLNLNYFFNQGRTVYLEDNEYIRNFIESPLIYNVTVSTLYNYSNLTDKDKIEIVNFFIGVPMKAEKYYERIGGYSFGFYNTITKEKFYFSISKNEITISNEKSLQEEDVYTTDGDYSIQFNELSIKKLFELAPE